MAVPIQLKCWSCGELKGKNVKLEAEAQALREEVAALRARVAEYEDEIVDHRNYSKACREREATKTMIVLVPERELFTQYLPGAIPQNADEVNARKEGWNACLDELARLNGKTVSEGLLRRIAAGDKGLWAAIGELRALLDGEPA